MIRGPRHSKPIEAVAQRGHKLLDQAMTEAMSHDILNPVIHTILETEAAGLRIKSVHLTEAQSDALYNETKQRRMLFGHPVKP